MGLVSAYCRSRWHGGVPADAPQTISEAFDRIDEVYNSGKPFFTKDSIRAVYVQFQRSTNRGDKVLVKDVAGTLIEYTLRTGETFIWRLSSEQEEEEWLIQQPILHYHGRGHLKETLRIMYQDAHYEPEKTSPLRSLQVYHKSEKLVSGTEELFQDPTLPSYDDLNTIFKEQIQIWQESEMCERVTQILNSSAAGLNIRKVVAVALGGISKDVGHRSAFQHALVVTLREWFDDQQQSVCCYAQDPEYKAVDKAVLQAHGVIAIDDPRAWLEVDERSILFSCAPNVPVKEIVADITRPAVIIWERIDSKDYDVEEEGKV
ncbi:hypothetical protein PENSUB_3491 [Penicillium subrubescens]|uniref:SRR1-like domain-containing protein n=2 Tax=Penicillium subrubescens TaxID=1316194 RepID=A0A1Q5UF43_9EURO|nr:hypothetical protein PENSUB_3491 [Penicillium subrubescens]